MHGPNEKHAISRRAAILGTIGAVVGAGLPGVAGERTPLWIGPPWHTIPMNDAEYAKYGKKYAAACPGPIALICEQVEAFQAQEMRDSPIALERYFRRFHAESEKFWECRPFSLQMYLVRRTGLTEAAYGPSENRTAEEVRNG